MSYDERIADTSVFDEAAAALQAQFVLQRAYYSGSSPGRSAHANLLQAALLEQHRTHIKNLVDAALADGMAGDPHEDLDPMPKRRERLCEDVTRAQEQWVAIWDLLVEKPIREEKERRDAANRAAIIEEGVRDLTRDGVISFARNHDIVSHLPNGTFVTPLTSSEYSNKYAILPGKFLASCAKTREDKSGDKKHWFIRNCFPRTGCGNNESYPTFDVAQAMGAIYQDKRDNTLFVRNVDFGALLDAFVKKHLEAGTGYWVEKKDEEVTK